MNQRNDTTQDSALPADQTGTAVAPHALPAPRGKQLFWFVANAVLHPVTVMARPRQERHIAGADPQASALMPSFVPGPARRRTAATWGTTSAPSRDLDLGSSAWPAAALPFSRPDQTRPPALRARGDHHLAAGTHTVELTQLADINHRLAQESSDARITASSLAERGHLPAEVEPRWSLASGNSVLVRVCADGPPEFPYIHGHFADRPDSPAPTATPPSAATAGGPPVPLHTAALSDISRTLGLRHHWGA